jgi:hypothetical protein
MQGEKVNLVSLKALPERYHCDCDYCKKMIGELRPKDGGYYSRLERKEYYDKLESGPKGHTAKTPVHIARWAIQKYTAPGEWVLDPTIGAGTTAVEALTQGRNVAGMEVQYESILQANIQKNLKNGVEAKVRIGDARVIGDFLREVGKRYTLLVNNPPYSGDEHQTSFIPEDYKHQSIRFKYKDGLPNLAFLKENEEYWDAMTAIYRQCLDWLEPGGHVVLGIKDMIRNKAPFMLHQRFAEVMTQRLKLKFVGTAFLKHFPATYSMNTYPKRYPGVLIPTHQTICVFRKGAK